MSTKSQSHKFYSHALFRDSERIQTSYTQAAFKQEISRRTAINRISWDLENGYITKKKTRYKHPDHRELLCGKNIYALTQKGKCALACSHGCESKSLLPNPKKRSSQSLENAVRSFFSAKSSEKEKAFSKILRCCPRWWKQNIKLLKKNAAAFAPKSTKRLPCAFNPPLDFFSFEAVWGWIL